MTVEISKQIANEIASCHLDRFKVWRYCGHLLFFRSFSSLSSLVPTARLPRCLSACLCCGNAGREKNFPNSGASQKLSGAIAKPSKPRSFSLPGWPSQLGVAVCQSIHPWHESTQTSTLSRVQNGTTTVRNLHHPPPPVAPGFKSPLSQQIAWKFNGTSQADMKSSAGSAVESIRRFARSPDPTPRFYY